MQLFVFSSKDFTNIWAAVGSRSWAVSEKQAQNPSIQARAERFQVGSLGLFYCSQYVTTPFLVSSKPRIGETVEHIWAQRWAMPFGIVPLGSPEKLLSASDLARKLPSLKGGRRWNQSFKITPVTAFSGSEIAPEDWAVLVKELT
jgi:hypothetical protein